MRDSGLQKQLTTGRSKWHQLRLAQRAERAERPCKWVWRWRRSRASHTCATQPITPMPRLPYCWPSAPCAAATTLDLYQRTCSGVRWANTRPGRPDPQVGGPSPLLRTHSLPDPLQSRLLHLPW